jgi:myo-inositol-1-phosphate synthase
MAKKVKVAIAGVGNCASALVQGTRYYKNKPASAKPGDDWIGLTAYNLGGIEPSDIEFVAAFDVADTKVGKDLSEAIFAKPNNTVKIVAQMDKSNIIVQKGEVHDGIGRHLSEKVKIASTPAVNVPQVLKDTGAEVLLNYLPVGSRRGTQYYAESCLEAGCAH